MSAAPWPVAPDSVRVWRGYRTTDQNPDKFADPLGKTFVPACALLQPKAGLCAYVPSLVRKKDKSDGVPDQTALMFWKDEKAHDDATNTVAARAYQSMHGDMYDMKKSSSQPPILLGLPIKAEQPYFLITRESDWMLGSVYHFVGGRAPAATPADFLAAIGTWAGAYRNAPPAGADGALLCAGNDYVAFWEHRTSERSTAKTSYGPISLLAQTCLNKTAERYVLPAGLWQPWPGIKLTRHDCINIQLARPGPKSRRGAKR